MQIVLHQHGMIYLLDSINLNYDTYHLNYNYYMNAYEIINYDSLKIYVCVIESNSLGFC